MEDAIDNWSYTGSTGANFQIAADGSPPFSNSGIAAGTQYFFFNENGAAAGESISQSFATTIDVTYEVTFDVIRLFNGAGTARINATVTDSVGVIGSSLGAIDATNGDGGETFSFTFTATENTSTLTFLDDSIVTGVDTSLESVSVVPVPEPSSSILLGLAGLGLVIRRKRK